MSTKSECDKWGEVHSKAVMLNELFDFLRGKKIILCNSDSDTGYFPILEKHDDLIYEFFGIDYNKLEKERRELLESIRSKQQ